MYDLTKPFLAIALAISAAWSLIGPGFLAAASAGAGGGGGPGGGGGGGIVYFSINSNTGGSSA